MHGGRQRHAPPTRAAFASGHHCPAVLSCHLCAGRQPPQPHPLLALPLSVPRDEPHPSPSLPRLPPPLPALCCCVVVCLLCVALCLPTPGLPAFPQTRCAPQAAYWPRRRGPASLCRWATCRSWSEAVGSSTWVLPDSITSLPLLAKPPAQRMRSMPVIISRKRQRRRCCYTSEAGGTAAMHGPDDAGTSAVCVSPQRVPTSGSIAYNLMQVSFTISCRCT